MFEGTVSRWLGVPRLGIMSGSCVCPGCPGLSLCATSHTQDRSRDTGVILSMWPNQAPWSSGAWHPVQVVSVLRQVMSLNEN